MAFSLPSLPLCLWDINHKHFKFKGCPDPTDITLYLQARTEYITDFVYSDFTHFSEALLPCLKSIGVLAVDTDTGHYKSINVLFRLKTIFIDSQIPDAPISMTFCSAKRDGIMKESVESCFKDMLFEIHKHLLAYLIETEGKLMIRGFEFFELVFTGNSRIKHNVARTWGAQPRILPPEIEEINVIHPINKLIQFHEYPSKDGCVLWQGRSEYLTDVYYSDVMRLYTEALPALTKIALDKLFSRYPAGQIKFQTGIIFINKHMEIEIRKHFESEYVRDISRHTINSHFNEGIHDIINQIETSDYQIGSLWIIKKVEYFDFIAKPDISCCKSYFPASIVKGPKAGFSVNMNGERDGACFQRAVEAGAYMSAMADSIIEHFKIPDCMYGFEVTWGQLWSELPVYGFKTTWDKLWEEHPPPSPWTKPTFSITSHVSLDMIDLFEKENPQYVVLVLGHNAGTNQIVAVRPIKIHKTTKDVLATRRIIILFIWDGHYFVIRSLRNILLKHYDYDKTRERYNCYFCLRGITGLGNFKSHISSCKRSSTPKFVPLQGRDDQDSFVDPIAIDSD